MIINEKWCWVNTDKKKSRRSVPAHGVRAPAAMAWTFGLVGRGSSRLPRPAAFVAGTTLPEEGSSWSWPNSFCRDEAIQHPLPDGFLMWCGSLVARFARFEPPPQRQQAPHGQRGHDDRAKPPVGLMKWARISGGSEAVDGLPGGRHLTAYQTHQGEEDDKEYKFYRLFNHRILRSARCGGIVIAKNPL